MVRALEALDHLGVGAAVARQQPRALELQRERGERVREHVVQLARDAAALGQRGRLGVRGARLAQLLDERLRSLLRVASRRISRMIRNHGSTRNSRPAITAGFSCSISWIATRPPTVPPQTTIAASRLSRMPPIAITK